jgi:NTE family protein
MSNPPRTALCLTGGGVTGAMYQVGALSALEAVVDDASFDLFVGTSSGAAVAAGLAGGVPVQRLYRALIDPADNFFPLERGHILSFDYTEWKRTIEAIVAAMRRGFAALVARSPAPMPSDVWEQLDRFFDALPAGLLSLDRYERFLSEVFLRRRIPNSFRTIDKRLLITAVDLDSGQHVLFGAPGLDHVPVSLACAASMALPVFFSPVRVGERFYIDGGVGPDNEIDIARAQGAELIVVINPNVPLCPGSKADVPTGYGPGTSLRDKGLMWVYNQSMRSNVHARLRAAIRTALADGRTEVLLIEPDPSEAMRFTRNAASPTARREILQWAHRSTRDAIRAWITQRQDAISRFGWRPASQERAAQPSVAPPPA